MGNFGNTILNPGDAMFCPACQTEYRQGFIECADGRVPLVHKRRDAGGNLPVIGAERRAA